MSKLVWCLLFAFGVVGCSSSSSQLTGAGEQVKVLINKKSGCQVLEKVVGKNEQGSQDLAENDARNLAGKLQANAIYFDEVVATGATIRVYGTAYRCQ